MTGITAEIAWPRPDDLTVEHLEQLPAGVPGLGVGIDTGALLYLRFTLDGVELTVDAVNVALDIAAQRYRTTFGALADPVQVTVYPADQGLVPSQVDLVNASEIGQMLDPPVSRQRVGQIVDRLPMPVAHPGGAPVWARWAVQAVTATWDRRSGRRPVGEPPAGA